MLQYNTSHIRFYFYITATSKPIPSFLLDAAREKQRNGYQNASIQYNTDLFPVIDLCTMDLPKQERRPSTSASSLSGSAVSSANELHAKHKHNEGEVTAVVLLPYSRVAELANKHNDNPGEEEDEVLEGVKNETQHPEENKEEESVIPEQEQHNHQPLAEIPELTATQNEKPISSQHPHRHQRHHQHKVHSHEEPSDWSPPEWPHHQNYEYSDSIEEEPEDEWNSWPKKHPHRLHHRYHHSGHRFHSVESANDQDNKGEDSRRLVVVPASELLALSEQLEREQARLQRTLQHHDDDLQR